MPYETILAHKYNTNMIRNQYHVSMSPYKMVSYHGTSQPQRIHTATYFINSFSTIRMTVYAIYSFQKCKYVRYENCIEYLVRTYNWKVWRIYHLQRRGNPRRRIGATDSCIHASSWDRAQTPSPQLHAAQSSLPLHHAAARDQTRQSGTPSVCVEVRSTNISLFIIGGSLTHATQNRSLQQPQCMCLSGGNSTGVKRTPPPFLWQPSPPEVRALAHLFLTPNPLKFATLIRLDSDRSTQCHTKVDAQRAQCGWAGLNTEFEWCLDDLG